ncbi:MAG TPA: dihydroneopterin aldolase [Burkholderiales bacterium]|nr:dihydroneopterin aldolase [Burkholderiales bacterium]
MDTIFIQELRVDIMVGYFEWERQLPQTIELNLEVAIPDNHAGRSDRIRDTIDYGLVVSRITESLGQTRFILLERVCEHVADLLMNEFRTPWVSVSAAKIGLMRGVRRIGVTIERGVRHGGPRPGTINREGDV